MKKFFWVLVRALSVVGCGSAPPVGPVPVKLLTYHEHCHPAPVVGLLVVDPLYGTAIRFSDYGASEPVAWGPGFTGRHAGSEIEVLAPDGSVLAVTGKCLEFAGVGGMVGGIEALEACGYAVPAPHCSLGG
jgi:hypothetical protein